MKERAFFLTCTGIALALSAIVYAPVFTGKIPFPGDFVFDFPAFAPLIPEYRLLPQTNIGDVVTSFYPYHTIAARTVREFSLPLWNPYMLSGAPFLAMAQAAVFYPPNFLYYLLSVSLAWTLSFFLRPVLATFFTALFIRRIGGSHAGAIASGLMFAFCGFLMAWQGQAMADAAIWLPLICYAVVRMHEATTARSVALGAIAFAMPVLAGHPETALHLTLTGSALAVLLWLREPKREFAKGFVLTGIAALSLAAIQILPTLEWLRYIHHPPGIVWPVPPLHAVLALVSRDIIRAKTSIGLLMPEHAAYIASATFLAAPLALLRRQSRAFVVFFAFVGAIGFLVAYGIGPVHSLVMSIPGLNELKNSRLTLVMSFSLSVLAGLGISEAEEITLSGGTRRRIRGLVLAAMGAAIALMLMYQLHLVPVDEVIERVRQPRFGFALLVAAGVTIGAALLGYLRRRVFALAMLGIIALDLGTVSYGAIPFTKTRDVFPPIPLFDKLPKDTRPFRIVQAGMPYGANFEAMYGLSTLGGYEIPLERLKALFTDISRPGGDSVMITPNGLLDTHDRRIDMFNARYFMVSEWDPRYLEFRKDPTRFRYLYTYGDTDVFENPKALERAFLVAISGIELIRDDAEQLRRIKDPSFDPEHSVILSEAPPSMPAKSGGDSRIQWRSFRANSIELDVTATDASVLVLSQVEYPGWKAYVDGQPVSIVRANYTLPAIFVSAGSHRVRFSFEPLSFKIGAALSLTVTALLAFMVRRGTDRSHSSGV